MRTDPTDNGGLFVGRRPGTAPVRYRDTPERGTAKPPAHRRARLVDAGARHDGVLQPALLGPVPGARALGRLAGAVQDRLRHARHRGRLRLPAAGILFGGLALLKRMDRVWILTRRAAGHDQRQGVIGNVFATTAVIGSVGFTFWLLFIGGLGSRWRRTDVPPLPAVRGHDRAGGQRAPASQGRRAQRRRSPASSRSTSARRRGPSTRPRRWSTRSRSPHAAGCTATSTSAAALRTALSQA